VVSMPHARDSLVVLNQVYCLSDGLARAQSPLPIADHLAAALLINCSTPEAVSRAIPAIARSPVPFGGYANGFTHIARDYVQKYSTVKQLTARTDLGPAAYADFAADWVAAGATIIGGCCEVGPAHIAELAHRFRP